MDFSKQQSLKAVLV